MTLALSKCRIECSGKKSPKLHGAFKIGENHVSTKTHTVVEDKYGSLLIFNAVYFYEDFFFTFSQI